MYDLKKKLIMHSKNASKNGNCNNCPCNPKLLRLSDKIHAQEQQFHFFVLYPIPILYPMKTHDLKKKLSMQAKNALKTKNYDNYPCNPKLAGLSVKTHVQQFHFSL